jgi:hypothetical protein
MDNRALTAGHDQTFCSVTGELHPCRNLAMSFFLLALIFFAGCQRDVVVPQHLIGEWKTTAPKYADRYLKLSEQTVTFGIGEGQEAAHNIDKIKSEQRDSTTVYTFYYRDAEGQKDSLTVTYRPDDGGTLQIKNSVEIWSKSATGQTE